MSDGDSLGAGALPVPASARAYRGATRWHGSPDFPPTAERIPGMWTSSRSSWGMRVREKGGGRRWTVCRTIRASHVPP
jgi:hypothetical protein